MRALRRNIIIITHDMGAAAVAFCFALYLRLGDRLFADPAQNWISATAIFAATAGIVFFLAKLHRGVWRYVSVRDLSLLLKAATAAVLTFVSLCFLLTRLADVPRSVPVIAWFILITFLGGSRLGYRLLREGRLARIIAARDGAAHRLPVLLIGAGDEAEMFLRALESDRDPAYRVIGAIDDKPGRVGRDIRGVPVLGEIQDLMRVMATLRKNHAMPAKLILTLSPNRFGQMALQNLFEKASALGIGLSRLPAMTLLRDAANAEALGRIEPRPVALEDLLGRPEAILDRAAIAALVAGKRVFVTGAGGSIGSELCQQIARLSPSQLTLCDSSEFNLYTIDLALREAHPDLAVKACLADVRERDHIMALMRKERPQLVFHAAALKHVPLMECDDNARAAVLTNVFGTQNVADSAAFAGAEAMVLISTDKAVNPTNIMGATKRLAEAYCQTQDLACHKTRFLTVRFGNVLGSTGSVVPRFTAQIAAGGPITVTHPEITRYFMTIREAVELVLQASAHGIGNGSATAEIKRGRIFVLDMGEPVRIVDLARQMIRLAGLRPDEDIRIEYSGLRPGEKLYEELFAPAEAPLPSGADGVLIAAPADIDAETVTLIIAELTKACSIDRGHNPPEAAREIRALLSRLHSNAGAAHPVDTGDDDIPEDRASRRASPIG